MKRWMIYGANGYTGRIISQLAHSQGLRPVLAGRNRDAVLALGAELGLETSVFALTPRSEVQAHLLGCELVLHCAGPFIETSAPMAEACIGAGAHYVDITGEIPVFAGLYERDERAKDAGVMLLGGGGFDVVPTDCVALKLKQELPHADTLRLAFDAVSTPSGGTMRSALAQVSSGGKVRENGLLVTIPLLSRRVHATLRGQKRTVFSVPWGDVFTAFHTTAIPNIEVYKVFSPAEVRMAKTARPFLGLLGLAPVLKLAQNLAGHSGPTAEDRTKGASYVWGQASAGRECVEIQLETIEGYQFTAEAAVRIAGRILNGEVRPGYQTPAAVYGADFALEIPGTRYLGLTRPA